MLYGQQASKIVALRTTEVSCADGAIRLKLGAEWLDVPEPVATLMQRYLRGRSSMAAMRLAFLGGGDWSAYAARRRAPTLTGETSL